LLGVYIFVPLTIIAKLKRIILFQKECFIALLNCKSVIALLIKNRINYRGVVVKQKQLFKLIKLLNILHAQ